MKFIVNIASHAKNDMEFNTETYRIRNELLERFGWDGWNKKFLVQFFGTKASGTGKYMIRIFFRERDDAMMFKLSWG